MKRSIIKVLGLASLTVFFLVFHIDLAEPSENAHESRFSDLSTLTDCFSTDISKDLHGKKLYFDNTCVREVGAQKISNFSLYLQNELESSFSSHGFIMVYEPSDAEYLIGANYQRLEDRVRVFFKYHQADLSGKKSRVYEILKSSLPKNAFEESIQTKAYDLASGILSGQKPLRVYVRPLLEEQSRYTTNFSNSFTSRIKCAMLRLGKGTQIIDEKPISQEAFSVSCSDADAVLDGVYFDRGEVVCVNLYLRDLEGKILASSIVDISKSLIKSSMENKTVKKLIDFLDPPPNSGDFNVKITTPKGKDYAIYSSGERIRFQIQVADPLYVYLYAINSKGNVSILFPHGKQGSHQKMAPGKLYTIPAKNSDFEIEVKPPFGIEAVKVFASRLIISLPNLEESKASQSYNGAWRVEGEKRLQVQKALSHMKSINPKDLVDFFRGTANRMNFSLYEDSLLLETREK